MRLSVTEFTQVHFVTIQLIMLISTMQRNSCEGTILYYWLCSAVTDRVASCLASYGFSRKFALSLYSIHNQCSWSLKGTASLTMAFAD